MLFVDLGLTQHLIGAHGEAEAGGDGRDCVQGADDRTVGRKGVDVVQIGNAALARVDDATLGVDVDIGVAVRMNIPGA
jgi:hypothetical protein